MNTYEKVVPLTVVELKLEAEIDKLEKEYVNAYDTEILDAKIEGYEEALKIVREEKEKLQ